MAFPQNQRISITNARTIIHDTQFFMVNKDVNQITQSTSGAILCLI